MTHVNIRLAVRHNTECKTPIMHLNSTEARDQEKFHRNPWQLEIVYHGAASIASLFLVQIGGKYGWFNCMGKWKRVRNFWCMYTYFWKCSILVHSCSKYRST